MQVALKPAGRHRRTHSREFQAGVVKACTQPGVSLAATALANGIGASLARRWVLAAQAQGTIAKTHRKPSSANAEFVTLQMPAISQPPGDIRVEIQRGAANVKVFWPVQDASTCAAWLRDWLK